LFIKINLSKVKTLLIFYVFLCKNKLQNIDKIILLWYNTTLEKINEVWL